MPTIVRGDVQAGYRGIPYRGVGVVAYAAPTGDFPCRSGVSRDPPNDRSRQIHMASQYGYFPGLGARPARIGFMRMYLASSAMDSS